MGCIACGCRDRFDEPAVVVDRFGMDFDLVTLFASCHQTSNRGLFGTGGITRVPPFSIASNGSPERVA